jgi:CO/xanthine dehydrogenase Mo-binding subunit
MRDGEAARPLAGTGIVRSEASPEFGAPAVATGSVSKKGEVRVERYVVALDIGPFLVNPLAVERQVEMQWRWGWRRRSTRR